MRKKFWKSAALIMAVLLTSVPVMASENSLNTTEQVEESAAESEAPSVEVEETVPEETPETSAETAEVKETTETSEEIRADETSASDETSTEDPGKDGTESTEETKEVDNSSLPTIYSLDEAERSAWRTSIKDYRFWQIGKTVRFAKKNAVIVDAMSDSAKRVGHIAKGGIVYLLKKEDGWVYVESGDVRGFMRADDLCLGNASTHLKSMHYYLAKEQSEEESTTQNRESQNSETNLLAVADVPPSENAAFTYYRVTTGQVVIEKQYAIANEGKELMILDGKSEDAQKVGRIRKGGLLYVIHAGTEWSYVESGDVRGYVKSSQIDTSEDAVAKAKEKEDTLSLAEALIAPADNRAYYHYLQSIEAGRPDGTAAESLTEYVRSFLGNSYVWNAGKATEETETSEVKNATDSAAFVQNVYSHYDVELPETAAEQAKYGKTVDVREVRPGDLVFYCNADGKIDRTAIYIGEGETVEVQAADQRVVRGKLETSKPVQCVRVLEENELPETLDSGNACEIIPGETVGGACTYERWNREWTAGTAQNALHHRYEAYDSEGFGRIGDRYVIACTYTFGEVGDLIDFELANGTIVKTVVGDIKNENDPGCNRYGHEHGRVVLEFIVHGGVWSQNHTNPGTGGCHPEWGSNVVRAINYGNML